MSEEIRLLDCQDPNNGRIAVTVAEPDFTDLYWTLEGAPDDVIAVGSVFTSSTPVNVVLTAYQFSEDGDTLCSQVETYSLGVISDIGLTIEQTGVDCEGLGIARITTEVEGETNVIWMDEFNAPIPELADLIEVSGLVPGIYRAWVFVDVGNDWLPCSDLKSITITGGDTLSLNGIVNYSTCPRLDSFGINEIELEAVGDRGPLTYFLNGQESDVPLFSNVPAGSYEAIVMDTTGCSASFMLTVEEPQILEIEAGPNQLIDLGTSTRINVLRNGANVDVDSIIWSPTTGLDDPNILNPTVVPTADITYTLTVDIEGCTGSGSVDISVSEPL
ncbi:MAG: hypothetical protein AAFU67_18580, partial [Bacteroidota bacterium]